MTAADVQPYVSKASAIRPIAIQNLTIIESLGVIKEVHGFLMTV